MGSRWCALVVCAAIVLVVRGSAAAPRVVIVETSDAPALPGLAARVQLHAGRPVLVTTVQDKTSPSMTYASRASAMVSEQSATIVVWVAAIEGEGGAQHTFLVFAAGRFPDRALLELVRLDATTPAGEVERTIALKIAGLFDTLVTAQPASAALGVTAAPIARWRLELSGGVVGERGDRGIDGRVATIVDRRWSLGDWIIAGGAALHWQPSNTISAPPGIVSLDELGARIAVGFERPLGSITLFARPEVAVAVLLARGTSVEGPHGSAVVFSPYVAMQAGARWAVWDRIELALAVAGEWALTRQQFLVDGEPAADLRHARGLLTLGLSIPLH